MALEVLLSHPGRVGTADTACDWRNREEFAESTKEVMQSPSQPILPV